VTVQCIDNSPAMIYFRRQLPMFGKTVCDRPRALASPLDITRSGLVARKGGLGRADDEVNEKPLTRTTGTRRLSRRNGLRFSPEPFLTSSPTCDPNSPQWSIS
jgi:hypothetical protein